MGIVHFGVPQRIIRWLRSCTSVNTFIETGTYLGGTAIWAAENFGQVISIEADENLHLQAQEKLKTYQNVELRLGRSQEVLRTIASQLHEPALVWLDAHWCGAGTAGEDSECPVIDEISAVDAGHVQHLILIDDARLFLNCPPQPHKPDHWPPLADVIAKLRARFSDAYICINDDVIVRIPGNFGPMFEQFMGSGEDKTTSKKLQNSGIKSVLAQLRSVWSRASLQHRDRDGL